VHLERLVGNAGNHLRRKELRNGGLAREALTSLAHSSCRETQLPCGLDVDCHVGEHPLNALKGGDRNPTDSPLLCPCNRPRKSRIGNADCAGGNLNPSRIEHLESSTEASAFRPEAVLLRNPAIERDFEDMAAPEPHRSLWLADPHAVAASLNNEGRDAPGTRRPVSLRVYNDEGRFACVRYKVLSPADAITRPLPHSPCRHLGGV
jgi:hypothetical protein